MHFNDVRLQGCSGTLFPAAQKYGVSEFLMRGILIGMYDQFGAFDGQKWNTLEKENPEFPLILKHSEYFDKHIDLALENELLKKTGDGYFLTLKARIIFNKASQLQKSAY